MAGKCTAAKYRLISLNPRMLRMLPNQTLQSFTASLMYPMHRTAVTQPAAAFEVHWHGQKSQLHAQRGKPARRFGFLLILGRLGRSDCTKHKDETQEHSFRSEKGRMHKHTSREARKKKKNRQHNLTGLFLGNCFAVRFQGRGRDRDTGRMYGNF